MNRWLHQHHINFVMGEVTVGGIWKRPLADNFLLLLEKGLLWRVVVVKISLSL